jgi:hypothetical protein
MSVTMTVSSAFTIPFNSSNDRAIVWASALAGHNATATASRVHHCRIELVMALSPHLSAQVMRENEAQMAHGWISPSGHHRGISGGERSWKRTASPYFASIRQVAFTQLEDLLKSGLAKY